MNIVLSLNEKDFSLWLGCSEEEVVNIPIEGIRIMAKLAQIFGSETMTRDMLIASLLALDSHSK